MPRNTPHILVIENNDIVLSLMEEILRGEGYSVTPYLDAGDGYEAVRATCPDLIILDLKSVGGDHGSHTLATLRRDPLTRDIPLIACSTDDRMLGAHSDRLERSEAQVLGKPFDLNSLVRMVSSILEAPPAHPAEQPSRTEMPTDL